MSPKSSGAAAWYELIMDPMARLPDQVFRGPIERFIFFEFDVVLTTDFGEMVRDLVKAAGDSSALAVVLEPVAEEYFRATGNERSLLLSRSGPLTAYRDWLTRHAPEEPADALIHSARVLGFAAQSGGWGVWAQRDFEVAVLGVRERSLARCIESHPVKQFSVREALHNLIALRYPSEHAPVDVVEKMIDLYEV